MSHPATISRKEFLLGLAAPALLPARPSGGGRLLIVVAHPDDEYAFAATTYRLTRELGWTADQVVITDGESGYRYSALAEAVYGKALANERDGRANLPAIRKKETERAGKLIGITRHYFLDQRDLGFAIDRAAAGTGNWDHDRVLGFVGGLLEREQYDVVFTLLPTAETHGHHRAAAAIAQEAVASLPVERRPLLLGAEPRSRADRATTFEEKGPSLVFDRTASFGYHDALNYQIVVNWVIAEHKSQGLFQRDCGRHELEEFWVLGGAASLKLSSSAEKPQLDRLIHQINQAHRQPDN
ncbi:MAG TPA: PIG-L family deacetylase [Candidatus Acidoferrum sp.]|nr:PIG-L family deacetylase [Candidatus Acidoferrum sp.]